MTDKIVPNPDWSFTNSTKYKHLLDGNAREIDVRDYGYDKLDNFRVMITSVARKKGYVSRSRKIDKWRLLFQVTGERKDNGRE